MQRATPSSHPSDEAFFPSELTEQILLRLPVKCLLQFRCVCKSWNSLISDSVFAKKHLRYSPKHLFLAFTNPSRDFLLKTCPLSSFFDAHYVNFMQLRHPLTNLQGFDLVIGSCDGILCIVFDRNWALLWNPSTGKYKKLPPFDIERRDGSHTMYGFGCDLSDNSFKVVTVVFYEYDGAYKSEVKVLTLGTDSWRRIQNFPFGITLDESGKYVSGTVNWLPAIESSSRGIVSLDLGKEGFQEILQPDNEEAVVVVSLGVLRDCLCLLYHSDQFSSVWLMKEHGKKDSWTRLFNVPHVGNAVFSPFTKVLCFSEDDKLLLQFGLMFTVYDPRNGTFEVPQIESINTWIATQPYIESLISP